MSVLRTPRDFELAIQKLENDLAQLKAFSKSTSFDSLQYYNKREVDNKIGGVVANVATLQNNPVKPETIDSVPAGNSIAHFLKHLFYQAVDFLAGVTFQSDLTVEGIFTANGDANFNNPVEFVDTVHTQVAVTMDGPVTTNDTVEMNGAVQIDGALSVNGGLGGSLILDVAHGGTGAGTHSVDKVLLGNGTSAFQEVTGVTNSIGLTVATANIQYKDWAGVNQGPLTVVTGVSISSNAFTKGVKTT